VPKGRRRLLLAIAGRGGMTCGFGLQLGTTHEPGHAVAPDLAAGSSQLLVAHAVIEEATGAAGTPPGISADDRLHPSRALEPWVLLRCRQRSKATCGPSPSCRHSQENGEAGLQVVNQAKPLRQLPLARCVCRQT